MWQLSHAGVTVLLLVQEGCGLGSDITARSNHLSVSPLANKHIP